MKNTVETAEHMSEIRLVPKYTNKSAILIEGANKANEEMFIIGEYIISIFMKEAMHKPGKLGLIRELLNINPDI